MFKRPPNPIAGPAKSPKALIGGVQRRLRRGARSLLLQLAHISDPSADLSALAHVERAVFTPRILGAPLPDLSFLFIGSCQIGHLTNPAASLDCRVEHMLYDSAWSTQLPPVDLSRYDAVVIGLTLRTLINEVYGGNFDLAHLRDDWDIDRASQGFDRCVAAISDRLTRLHAQLAERPCFIFTFLEPSFSYFGQLQPGADLDHPAPFVRRLNAALAERVAEHSNFYLYDINEAFNVVGRLHLHDDVVANFTHAATIGTIDDTLDGERLVTAQSNHRIYDVKTALPLLQSYVFRGLIDAVKIVRGVDRVKLIIVDLDDTLWRGVAAESDMEGWARIEGWPLGFAEALLYFKKRGGLLAICSKNDHDATVQRFAEIWGDRLTLDDFVCVQINWRSKAANIQLILDAVNILPDQTVFIDDNPRELAEVGAQFPTLRCLGGNPREWRKIILRSPETQTAEMTAESARRTELVKARIDRDLVPQALAPQDRTAWLTSLDLHQKLILIEDTRVPQFARALELLNKTNQFNTTGQRWTLTELERFLAAGGLCLAASLKDRTIDNGLIAVALVRPGEIVQVVLSCRVFGLGAETVLGAAAVRLAMTEAGRVTAALVDTGKNLSCRSYFTDLGFAATAQGFETAAAPDLPGWITVELDRGLKARIGTLEAMDAT